MKTAGERSQDVAKRAAESVEVVVAYGWRRKRSMIVGCDGMVGRRVCCVGRMIRDVRGSQVMGYDLYRSPAHDFFS